MSSIIVEELVSVLEYRLEGGKNAKKFGEELDRLENKARKHGTTIAAATKRAAGDVERAERRKRTALKKTDKQASASRKFLTNQKAAIAGLATGFGAVQAGRFALGAIADGANLERELTRIGIKAEATRDQTKAALTDIQELTLNFGFSDIRPALQGLDTLTETGFNLQESLDFLPSVLLTAQASGAATQDIALTAESLATSLKITSDEMQHSFDILVAAGKAGKFELKDMAKELPTLASGFQAIGGTGIEGLKEIAAILQTIRIRTGSSGQAATQLQNIFSKLNSQQTTKAFKKRGIDLDKVFKDAADSGESLIDALVRATDKATGGGLLKSASQLKKEVDEAVKGGEKMEEAYARLSKELTKADTTQFSKIFTDQEFRLGMLSLVSGREDLKGLLDELSRDDVNGGAMGDFSRLMDDNQAKIDKMSASWEIFKNSLYGESSNVISPALDFFSNHFVGNRLGDLQEDREAATKGVDEAAVFQKKFGDFAEEEQKFFGGFRKRKFTAKDRAAFRILTEEGDDALERSNFNGPTKLRVRNLKKKADQISGGSALATDSGSQSVNNRTNQTVTNNIDVDVNVANATDAPGEIADATASALADKNINRAQLQIEPSQP